MCIHTSRWKVSGLESDLDITVGGFALDRREEATGRARREPARHERAGSVELLDDRAEPAAEVAKLGRPAAQEGEQRTDARGSAEEMGQGVRALAELDRLHPRLIEEDRALEHIHG